MLAGAGRVLGALPREASPGLGPPAGRLRRWGRRIVPWIPLTLLVGACLLVAAAVSSCGGDRIRWPAPPPPEATMPTIRVLLGGGEMSAAVLEAPRGGRFTVDGRVVSEAVGEVASVRVSRSGPTWRLNSLAVDGDVLALEVPEDGRLRLGPTSYRGKLLLHPVGTDRFLAVNHLDMETYLAGVLPKELYAFWSPQTYRAQAIAARTFAMFLSKTFGRSHHYDLGDNQASQMYGGFAAETPKAWRAVRDSHGVVLAYGPAGQEKIFLAQYSACNGGVVNGAYVIRDAPRIPPLEGGQADEDGRRCRHYVWDPVRIPRTDLHAALRRSDYAAAARLQDVREIRVASQTPYGRMHWLDVVDSRGNLMRLRAEDLRLVLLRWGPPAARALYSMNCRIRDLGEAFEFYDGRGFGHGVGLSQWGAEDKAQRGMTAEQILEFYYPGATLVRAY